MNNNNVINYYIQYNSIFSTGCFRNSVKIFYDMGYKINVFQFKDNRLHIYPSYLDKYYCLVEIPYPQFLKYILFVIKYLFRTLKKLDLKKTSTVGDSIDVLFKAYYYVFYCMLYSRAKNGEVHIAGDPVSLIAVNKLLKKRKIKGTVIYWSLELYIYNELNDYGLKYIKKKEIKYSRDADLIIDFGDTRCKLLCKENNLPINKMISIPNSSIGPGVYTRNKYFNEKFGIPNSKKIILHAGGLFPPIYHVSKIIKSVYTWPDNYVLILHTTGSNYPGSGFTLPKELINNKIFLSKVPLPYEELIKIYSSCDIGISLLGPAGLGFDSNLIYTDLSLGKIFHYIKYGVPVIVKKSPGFNEEIESYEAGICIDNENEILPALNKIFDNYHKYSNNALKLFNKYEFSKYHNNILKIIGISN